MESFRHPSHLGHFKTKFTETKLGIFVDSFKQYCNIFWVLGNRNISNLNVFIILLLINAICQISVIIFPFYELHICSKICRPKQQIWTPEVKVKLNWPRCRVMQKLYLTCLPKVSQQEMEVRPTVKYVSNIIDWKLCVLYYIGRGPLAVLKY